MIHPRKDEMGDVAQRMVDAGTSGRSPWAGARARFVANKAAVAGMITLLIVSGFALIGPVFTVYEIDEIDFAILGEVAELGTPSLSNGHYFGTDRLGRDMFARVVGGTQVSLTVGVIGAAIAVIVGTLYGAVSGYFGGVLDSIMMRLVDILMSIPYMFVLILLLVMFGRSITMLFIGIGLVSWLDMSRIVRGQTLALKNQEFIDAATAAGASGLRIVFRHIVPNLLGVVVVYASLLIPGMIMTESFISFLGLGVQEPNTSWGTLIAEGADTLLYGTYWQLGFPLLFFMVTLFALYFVGDGLRDALDPRSIR